MIVWTNPEAGIPVSEDSSLIEGREMFKDLIKRIREAVKLNIEHADRGNVQSSYYTYGQINGYIDVLESIGHKVIIVPSIGSNGSERIRYMAIDGIVIVQKNEIDYDGYDKLLER